MAFPDRIERTMEVAHPPEKVWAARGGPAAAGQRGGFQERLDRGDRRHDWETYRREGPGMSAFALEDGVVHHTYSAYERGLDAVWGMYQWLDRAPLGRNETGHW